MSKKPKSKNKNKKKPIISRPLWWTVLIAGIAALVCSAFLIARWSLNAFYVAEAKKGKYISEIEEMLSTLNFPDGYVVWYNLGNYHFQSGNFEAAEEDYYRAIECGIPYEKECPVKVNLALAMIEQLSDEEWEAFLECETHEEMNAQAREVEKTLITAREILIEDGCAHKDDEDGHYKDAQTLKDEIDELLDFDDSEENDQNEDEEEQDENDPDGDSDDEEDGGGDDQSSREDQVMQHIQEQKEEAQGERAEDQQFYENYYGFGDESGGSEEEGGGGNSADDNGEIW